MADDDAYGLCRDRQVERARGPQAAASIRSGKIARRPHPRRTVYVRSAGNRHLPENPAGAAFLRDFVEEAKSSGLVARLIDIRSVAFP